MFQQPANYFSDTALQEHWWDLEFPSRKLRCRPTKDDIAAFTSKKAELRPTAAEQEQRIPVSFALENRWSDTIQDDKAFYQNNTLLRMTGYFPFSPHLLSSLPHSPLSHPLSAVSLLSPDNICFLVCEFAELLPFKFLRTIYPGDTLSSWHLALVLYLVWHNTEPKPELPRAPSLKS